MLMSGRVVEVSSGSAYNDGVERVKVRFEEADQMYNCLRAKNTEGWKLDDVVTLTLGLTRFTVPSAEVGSDRCEYSPAP